MDYSKREEILATHCNNGVHIPLADGVLIGEDVVIESGVTILPGCILEGHTHIRAGAVIGPNVVISDCMVGEGSKVLAGSVLNPQCRFGKNCIIGPNVVLEDTQVGDEVQILSGTVSNRGTVIGDGSLVGPNSYLSAMKLEEHCRFVSSFGDSSWMKKESNIGPMSQLRANCVIGEGAHIGDFVEVKNSNIGAHTALAHLTYIGDSDIGESCNFGCGVVTANYDGSQKFRTTIGNQVFVGCNTNLVAPVKMGDGSYAATGTTVTQDVPPDSLVIGRVRQEVKKDWCKNRRLFQKKKK